MPSHWRTLRLRFAAELNPSKSEISHLGPDTEVTFLPMEAIGDDGRISIDRVKPISEVMSGYTYLREGDVAVAKITPCFENGKGAVVTGLRNGIAFGTTELIVARPKHGGTTSEYLHRLFSSTIFRQFGEASMYGAGGQKRVPDDFVRDFKVCFPPLNEQKAISKFLDHETSKIDALIEEQKRLIELLKEKRQAVISQAVTKGLDPDVPMKASGVEWLGKVPAHWRLKRIRHLILSVEQGWSPQCEGYPVETEQEWGVLKVGCVNGGIFIHAENKALPPELAPQPRLSLLTGDLLVSRANTRELVGSAAVVERDFPNLLLCDKLYRLRFDTTEVSPTFIARYLGTPGVRSRIELSATGASSSMVNIGQGTILEIDLALPNLVEQEAICCHIEGACVQLDALTIQADAGIELLNERRSALISAAVTGKIDVRDRMPQVEAAAA